MIVNAHVDGRVIISDEPLNLAPNQALIVQIEPLGGTSDTPKESALTWLAANAAESLTQPTDLADPQPLPLRPSIEGRAAVVPTYFADTSF